MNKQLPREESLSGTLHQEELQQVEVAKELTPHEKIMDLIKKIETQVEQKIPFSKKRRSS